MAHIEGYPSETTKTNVMMLLCMFIIIMLMAALFLMGSASSWKEKIGGMVVVGGLLLFFVSIVAVKVNPMGWKKLFSRAEFKRLYETDQMIMESLTALDDSRYIFYDFNLELSHVEILVVGPQGIFVIAKITDAGPVRLQDGILFAGRRSQTRRIRKLMKAAHLIETFFKEKLDAELNPVPILMPSAAEAVTVNEYEGVSILSPQQVIAVLENGKPQQIQSETVSDIAEFIKKRYF